MNKSDFLARQSFYPSYLLILCGFLFFPGLGARDFWAPVEPRYAEIARIMFTKGEWIVPMVNGDLYTDKPVLYFWLVLVVSNLAGAVNEWTVRLPVALGAIGFVWATYRLGRDFFSARIGLLGGAVLATTVRVMWEARWAHIDAIFCFLFVLSLYYAARALLQKGSANEILPAYVFMALATLAKGFIGVVLPALLLIGYMVARRHWSMLRAAKLHIGIPLFLLVAAPWFYLVNAATEGRWLTEFIYVHHLQRYTSGAGHRQPFYYYLTTLPVDLLPWTVFALPAVFAYRDYRRLLADPTKLFLIVWFLVVFLFFSASDTKRDLYLMPLLPPVALFVAHYFADLESGRLPKGRLYRILPSLFFALVALAGLCAPLLAWLLRRDVFWISLPVAAVLIVGGATTVLFILRHRPLKVFAAITATMLATLLCAVIWVFPYIERFKSRRFFSEEVQRIVPSTAPLYIYSDEMHDFNYYTGREVISVLESRAEVEKLLGADSRAYILIKARDLKRLGIIGPERIRITGAVGSTVWNLVALGRSVGEP